VTLFNLLFGDATSVMDVAKKNKHGIQSVSVIYSVNVPRRRDPLKDFGGL
jgi:hypothetical protein